MARDSGEGKLDKGQDFRFATAALHEIGRFRPIEIPKISSHVHKTTKFARLPIETEFLSSQQ